MEVKIKSILQQCSNICSFNRKLKMGNSFDSNYSWSPLSSLSVGQIGFLLKLNSDSPTNHSTVLQVCRSLNYLELNNIFHLNLHEYFYFAQDDLEKKKITPQRPLDESLTCCHLLSLLARHLLFNRINHSEDFIIFFVIKKS